MKQENDCVQNIATEGKGNGVSLFEVFLQNPKTRTPENHSKNVAQLRHGPKLKKSTLGEKTGLLPLGVVYVHIHFQDSQVAWMTLS